MDATQSSNPYSFPVSLHPASAPPPPPPSDAEDALSADALWLRCSKATGGDAGPPPDPFLTRVRAVIVQSLATAKSPVDTAASALSMSRRTFQRNLARRGLTYQDVRDDLRRIIATTLLSEADYTSGELARALGYGHVTAFHRAFRRWTGTTPFEYSTRARGVDRWSRRVRRTAA